MNLQVQSCCETQKFGTPCALATGKCEHAWGAQLSQHEYDESCHILSLNFIKQIEK